MKSIFHITTRQAWEIANAIGVYEAESLRTEGFIHLSSHHQVLDVANNFFKGQSDLVLIHVDQDLVKSPLKHELVGAASFPHLYGPLNLDAVFRVYEFSEQGIEGFTMPSDLKLTNTKLENE